MKKLFLFFALLAGIAVMTGCKKDQDGITLKAVIDRETKAYFGNDACNLPYWDSDDQVNVNGTSYGLDAQSVSTTFASITGVTTSSVYCAIYPANALEPGSMTPSVTQSKATIKFDSEQQYIWENNRQRVNMPMGAVTTDEDKTLIFRNLCSVLRLKVSNKYGADFAVKRLTVTSFGGYVSGLFDVSLSYNSTTHQTDVPGINPSSLNNDSEDNTLTLHVPNKIIPSNDCDSFDIVVPPFNAQYLILEAELLDANGKFLGYTSDTVAVVREGWTRTPGHSIIEGISGRVSVDRNKIVTVGLNVNNVTDVLKFDYGYLVPGPEFNKRIRNLIGDRTNITTIAFNRAEGILVTTHHLYYWDGTCGTTVAGTTYDTVNNHPAGWVEVQTQDSPHKIWAYIVDNTVIINSWAHFIYANTDSDSMFADLPTISNIQWNTTRDYGFQTEDVTDMSYMFAGSTSLTTITSVYEGDVQKLYFNTTNVTNMAHMFDSCVALGQLKLSFNTHNVKDAGMVAMFKDCYSLQTLDISSFTTDRITDMTNMFKNCKVMTTLNMEKFVISSNTTITNMCDRLNYDHHSGSYNENNPVSENPCNITCKVNTWNTLKGQANLSTNPIDPTTGLDLRIVQKSSTDVGK